MNLLPLRDPDRRRQQMTTRHPIDERISLPERFPDGTRPGRDRLIGQRCDVFYTDNTGKLPQYVQRVGVIAAITPDGTVTVRLPWGLLVTVVVPGEVVPWE